MKYIKEYEEYIACSSEELNEQNDKFIKYAKELIPDYENIVVTKEDEMQADKIYNVSLNDDYWKNDEPSNELNKRIDKILNKIKEKNPDINWKILQKPIYDKIHSGLT